MLNWTLLESTTCLLLDAGCVSFQSAWDATQGFPITRCASIAPTASQTVPVRVHGRLRVACGDQTPRGGERFLHLVALLFELPCGV